MNLDTNTVHHANCCRPVFGAAADDFGGGSAEYSPRAGADLMVSGELPRLREVAAMMRPIVLFALLSFSLLQSAQAHLADESSLRVKIEPHRLETRLTFNLFTLTRFVKIDSDGDTKISLAELTAAEPGTSIT